MADKNSLEFVQSSKNIIADSVEENYMNNLASVPTSSEMRNVMKSIRRHESYLDIHSNGEMNNKTDDIEQSVGKGCYIKKNVDESTEAQVRSYRRTNDTRPPSCRGPNICQQKDRNMLRGPKKGIQEILIQDPLRASYASVETSSGVTYTPATNVARYTPALRGPRVLEDPKV
ncbi:hypothetical protein TNCV_1960752 [Trichonephila clavipes]|nr:hypothetical protein TNCV_1960752 [Trichonephila clavipes]